MVIFRGFAIYLAFAGIILAILLIKKLGAPDPDPKPVAAPASNPYEFTISASGIIEAVDRNIAIGVPQPGLVTDIFVKVWDRVAKGQPLFQLDDRELQAQYLVQKANIKVAEANLNRLRSLLMRLESIPDIRAISQEELDTRRHDVIVAEAQLATAYAQSQQTLLSMDRLIVCAPGNGVILQNNIRVGEFVSSTMTTPALILGNLDRLQVRVDVDEQNACHVNPLLSATAFLKNNTETALPLRFERIEPYVVPKKSLTGASDERVDTRVLQVLYSFDKPQEFPIYVGQQVDVFIERPLLAQKEEPIQEEG